MYGKQASCEEAANHVQLCGSVPKNMRSAERTHAQDVQGSLGKDGITALAVLAMADENVHT